MDRRKAIKRSGYITANAILAPALLSIFQSCQTENRLDWTPQFFTEPEANCITSLLDTILPRTETPGALDVNVDVFMDKVIAKTYDSDNQKQIRQHISDFNTTCESEFGKPFSELTNDQKTVILNAEESSSGKFSGSVWGTAVGPQAKIGFYRSFKAMAISAYFSSEKIGKSVLNYDPIPQEYIACVPLSDIGNRWTF